MSLKPDPAAPSAAAEAGARRHALPVSRVLLGFVAVLLVAAGVAAAAGVLPGGPATASRAGRAVAAVVPKGAAMAPLPKAHPKLVQPVAGESSTSAADGLPAGADSAPSDDTSLPKVTGPATVSPKGRVGSPGAGDLTARKATALGNGVALPPLEAPEPVLNVIRAGNIIARSPYKWGGGHGRFQDNGYDCSGSVTYALYYAGLIDGPHTSGDLMAYGKPGKGRWITIYANGGHVWMTVAGIRFDTSGQKVTGSRWQNEIRSGGGYEIRHPAGL